MPSPFLLSKATIASILVVSAAAAALAVRLHHDVAAPPASLDVVWIPGGEVMLGSREPGSPVPPHRASLEGFWLGRHEVTCAEYARFLSDTHAPAPPGQFAMADGDAVPHSPRHAVSHVSMLDAEAYCAWLSARVGKVVRLPTTDEWEHAARGGIGGAPYPWGWGSADGRMDPPRQEPADVGRHPPNGHGLQDMAGHLAEWCRSGGETWLSGGSWAEQDPLRCRVWSRSRTPESYRDADAGFRILLEAR